MAEPAMVLDLADFITEMARDAHERARREGLVLLYDYLGSLDMVDASPRPLQVLIEHGIEHIVARSHAGYVFFGAEVSEAAAGRCRLVCQVASASAGAGTAGRPTEIAQFPGVSWTSFWQSDSESDIRGSCDLPDGLVCVHTRAREGMVVRIECTLACEGMSRRHDSMDARGAAAWLVADPPLAASTLSRRLQRLGWRTSVFPAVRSARAALAREGGAPPRMVIGMQAYRVDAEDFAALARALPSQALAVLAVPRGASVAVAQADGGAAFELVVQPIGPRQLLEVSRHLRPAMPAQRTGDTVPAALAQSDRLRVLVVDDNAVNQVLAKEMLQLLGYEADIADDGLSAISHCKRACPHAVLMDVNMPRLNGMQATQQLRALQQRGVLDDFPVIGATADPLAREACCAAGMDDFITKPILLDELDRALRGVLARDRRGRALRAAEHATDERLGSR